jgi:diaminopimelate decarboxylase
MLEYVDNQLAFAGIAIRQLAGGIETPFFLVSERRLRENYAALTRGLGACAGAVRYCAKTNNEAGVLSILAGCGSSVLVSHLAEALLAFECGFAARDIAYQKPVILEGEIRPLLRAGITLLHAFRMEDLDRIEQAAQAEGCEARILLRLRDGRPGFCLSPLGFLSGRLGFAGPELVRAALRVRASGRMALQGINCYGGTQREALRRDGLLLRRMVALAGELRQRHGIDLAEINLGGGLPSPAMRRVGAGSLLRRLRDDFRFSGSTEPIEARCRRLADLFRAACSGAGLDPAPRLTLEPGRALVADAAVLVTAVRALQGKWLFLDASRNVLGESPLLLTRQILPALRRPGRRERFFHLSGGTLNTMDLLDLHRRLPTPEAGDLLVFGGAGAYSISRAARYAGLAPAVYLLGLDGSLRKIRRREGAGDLAGPMLMAFRREGEGAL